MIFKGSGFYVTDYVKKGGGESKSSGSSHSGKLSDASPSKADAKSDAKSETKSESKGSDS